MNDNSTWHYAENGSVIGPISLEEIKALITEGKITVDTSVWNGEGDWKAAKSTVLGGLLIKSTPSPSLAVSPSPTVSASIRSSPRYSTATATNNTYAWLLVAVPIFGLIVDLMTGKSSVWVFIVILFVCNAIFLMLDQKTHKAKGIDISTKGWNNLIPVYLWNRAKQFNQPKFYVWAWVASFVISAIVVFTPTDSNTDMSAADRAALQQQLNTEMQAPVETAQESNKDSQ